MNRYKHYLILFLIIILFTGFFMVQCMKIRKSIDRTNEARNEMYYKCQNDIEIKEKLDSYCSKLGDKPEKTDFINNYQQMLSNGISSVDFIMPIFVMASSLFYVSRYFKNGIVKNDINRLSYKKILLNIFKESYLSLLLILPFIFVVIYTIIISGSVTSEYSLLESTVANALWTIFYIKRPVLFIIMYILSILLHFILYINIGLIIVRKYHNYYIAVLLSFLTLIGVEAFLELGLNVILCGMVLKNPYGIIFNLFNYIYFNNYSFISNNDTFTFMPFVVPLIATIITFIILFIIYKDKESLITDCEKKGVII